MYDLQRRRFEPFISPPSEGKTQAELRTVDGTAISQIFIKSFGRADSRTDFW